MYTYGSLLPLSALQYFIFCKRQCAPIHIERLWFENRYTAEGQVMHKRVDSGKGGSSGDLSIEYV